jgi:hypothetical protein
METKNRGSIVTLFAVFNSYFIDWTSRCALLVVLLLLCLHQHQHQTLPSDVHFQCSYLKMRLQAAEKENKSERRES